jgi:hypothetical protein
MSTPLAPSPPLDTTINDGDTGQLSWAQAVSACLNALPAVSTSNPAPIAASAAPGATGLLSDAGHVHFGVTIGTSNPKGLSKAPLAGTSGTAADSDHVHAYRKWLPSDNGLLWATDDPGDLNSSNSLGASPPGNILLMKGHAGSGFTIANVVYALQSNGTSLTAGQNFVGVYSSAGVLLGKSADQTTNYQSGGGINVAIVAPITAEAGQSLTIAAGDDFYVAMLVKGTGTGPTLPRCGSSNVYANLGLTGAGLRFAQIVGTASALPANFTPSSLTNSTGAYWIGVS